MEKWQTCQRSIVSTSLTLETFRTRHWTSLLHTIRIATKPNFSGERGHDNPFPPRHSKSDPFAVSRVKGIPFPNLITREPKSTKCPRETRGLHLALHHRRLPTLSIPFRDPDIHVPRRTANFLGIPGTPRGEIPTHATPFSFSSRTHTRGQHTIGTKALYDRANKCFAAYAGKEPQDTEDAKWKRRRDRREWLEIARARTYRRSTHWLNDWLTDWLGDARR